MVLQSYEYRKCHVVTGITVTDSDSSIGQVGTIDSNSLPENPASLTAAGTAAAGNYGNTGTLSGQPVDPTTRPSAMSLQPPTQAVISFRTGIGHHENGAEYHSRGRGRKNSGRCSG